MRKLYGTSRSRASRCLVALEELGLDYDHVPIQPMEMRDPGYRTLNPNGRVPCLDDDGTVLFESLAINLYLASRYGHAPIWPDQAEDRGRAYQWSFWVANEVETLLTSVAMARTRGDDSRLETERARLARPFGILDRHLETCRYLLGAEHSIVDVNLATSLSEPHELARVGGWDDFDLERFPHLARWLERCHHRPSFERVRGMS